MLGSVPTPAERGGDFSQVAAPSRPVRCTIRSAPLAPFPNNGFPRRASTPPRRGLLPYFPNPTLPRNRAELPLRHHQPERQPHRRRAVQCAAEQQGPAEFQLPEADQRFGFPPAFWFSRYQHQLRPQLLDRLEPQLRAASQQQRHLFHSAAASAMGTPFFAYNGRTSRRNWALREPRRSRSTMGRRASPSPISRA